MESSNKWYLGYCQRIHKQKLSEIKSRPSKRIDNVIPYSLSVVNRRQKVFQIKKLSNVKELVKENRNIMNRISLIAKKFPGKVVRSQLLNSKSQKVTQIPKPRRILKTNTCINSPTSPTKQSLTSSHRSIPRLQLSNINILQPPSPDTPFHPFPSFTETPPITSPSQASYIKIISPSSQNDSFENVN